MADARVDLAEIGDHYRDVGGKALALRMVRGIRQEVLALADNPHIAPPYEIAPNIHRLVVTKGAFLVFYRVSDCVEVVHVRRTERVPFTERELDAGNDPPGAVTPDISEERRAEIRKSPHGLLKTGLQ